MMVRSNAARQQELMNTFYEEVRDLTEEMANLLLASETEIDSASLHRLCRGAHTIKGSSQLVGFDRLGETAEVLEKVFKAVAEGSLRPTTEVIARLREGVEVCRQLLSSRADEQYKDLLGRLLAMVRPQRREGISS